MYLFVLRTSHPHAILESINWINFTASQYWCWYWNPPTPLLYHPDPTGRAASHDGVSYLLAKCALYHFHVPSSAVSSDTLLRRLSLVWRVSIVRYVIVLLVLYCWKAAQVACNLWRSQILMLQPSICKKHGHTQTWFQQFLTWPVHISFLHQSGLCFQYGTSSIVPRHNMAQSRTRNIPSLFCFLSSVCVDFYRLSVPLSYSSGCRKLSLLEIPNTMVQMLTR